MVEVFDHQLAGFDPTAQIRSEPQLLLGRETRVAFNCEPGSERLDIVSERAVSHPLLAFWIGEEEFDRHRSPQHGRGTAIRGRQWDYSE